MIQGSIDGLDRHLISGWAYDTSLPDRAVAVTVFMGDQLLCETEAGVWRSDLAEAGIGNGCHSFVYVLPAPIEEEDFNEISVVVEGTKLPINRSFVGKPSDAFFVGSIERLDRYGVAGWAYNKAAPDHTVSLAISFEDRLLGTVEADLPRPDLEAAIGSGRHGFRYAFSDEIPEDDLSKVVVQAGTVDLTRALPLQPFHASLAESGPASGIGQIWSRAVIFPVTLRRTFEISSESVIGRVMRLLYKEFPPSAERINPILYDLREAVKGSTYEKLHMEKMSVSFGERIEEVEVSRTNSHFVSVDRGVREFRNGYEPEILASIDLFVPNDGVLLDIGANWGCFSIFLAARPAFSGMVHAFEPSSLPFQDMVKIVEKLNLTNRIVCHKLGLADYTGSAQLSVGLDSGLSSISNSVADNYAVTYDEVQISQLDALSLPAADLIKIDVEGVEAQVIRGGERYIRAAKPAIIFENWMFPDDLKKTSEPLEILDAWGYEFLLPCWTNKEKTLFSSIPLGEGNHQLLALCPFGLRDRALLDERVNILAVSKGSTSYRTVLKRAT